MCHSGTSITLIRKWNFYNPQRMKGNGKHWYLSAFTSQATVAQQWWNNKIVPWSKIYTLTDLIFTIWKCTTLSAHPLSNSVIFIPRFYASNEQLPSLLIAWNLLQSSFIFPKSYIASCAQPHHWKSIRSLMKLYRNIKSLGTISLDRWRNNNAVLSIIEVGPSL